VTGPVRPGGSRSARVCVSPSQGGAELRTFVGGEPVLSQTIIADGIDHPVSDGGCTGTQRAALVRGRAAPVHARAGGV
jgi:hypothetical protein